jgi:hypothetical protein
MILSRVPGGYRVIGQVDAFPNPKNVSVVFPRRNLDPGPWTTRDFGPYRVFVRR